MENLSLYQTDISDCEPLKNLTKIRELCLDGTQVSNLASLKELTNLQILKLRNTQVSDLEPLKELKNIKSLYIGDFSDLSKYQNINITEEQIDNLKKTLPNLEIIQEPTFKFYKS